MDKLNKIYVEPTSRCNLNCVTCIRHSWDEPFGDMDWSVYEALIDGLRDLPTAKIIAFAGFGEPLTHPRFPDMVRLAHERGLRTEMTSNAMLLNSELAEKLIDAGLDQFTVSIDGTSEEAHGDVRPGASLEAIKNNVLNLYRTSKQRSRTPLRIGMEFVAMKSNIHELPVLQNIAGEVRASFVVMTNILPYTAELQDEILYWLGANSIESEGVPHAPLWILPYIDWNSDTVPPLASFMRQRPELSLLDINLTRRRNYCPFVQIGSLAVAWHGGISPCPPLLHSYRCFIMKREKAFRRCEYGHLSGQSLSGIWSLPEYVAFRERVRKFEFSPCTDCGGCDYAERNEKDCFGNTFPVCGDCLWARGILRCA